MRIYTMGRFAVMRNGRPLNFSTESQKRPLDLLQALVAFGGRDVHIGRIIEALWPEADGDAAYQTFSTTLHRLRRLIGFDALVLRQRRLSLNADLCWLDTWALERRLNRCDPLRAVPTLEEALEMAPVIARIYRGNFIEGESGPWIIARREILQLKLLQAVERLAERICSAGQYRVALALYVKGLEINPLAESLHRGLMRCYLRSGSYAEALSSFERCRTLLDTSLGIEPSPDTRDLQAQVLREATAAA
jgi:DNA-binding SARP family transcriptional activator